jgi:hypothetical protein
MNQNPLRSLRLGFSNKENSRISQKGIHSFLEGSFKVPFDTNLPDFLNDSPKTIVNLKQLRLVLKNAADAETVKKNVTSYQKTPY